MKHTYTWLLIAALLALLTPSMLLAADEAGFSSSIEVGAAGMSVDDEVNKVNEYSATRDDDGVNPYVKANLNSSNDGTHLGIDAEVMGEDNMDLNLDADLNRFLRVNASYGEFNHWLSHDQINYMDATMKTQGQTSSPASANPSVYGEDLVPNKDFFIIHKEFEMSGEVVIPDLPNVTLKTGFREETREGVQQAFGMSHCSSCHVEGDAKKVDETTRDFTIGANGKFGMMTVDYEYLTRDFDDKSGALAREYQLAGKPFPGYDVPVTGLADFAKLRLLYDQSNGELPYAQTPDSEKDSHTLKARYDLANDTVISAGYINADITSNKQDDDGRTLAKNSLSTDYDSYNMRASTRFNNLRLTGFGRKEEIDDSNNSIFFTYANGNDIATTAERQTYASEEARDITTFGGNAVYRITSGTSVRFGYEYEDVDRALEEATDTETHTIKVSARFRPSSKINGRISYTYQDIDEQFMHPHGNKGPIEEDFVYIPKETLRWYEEFFYALREAEASSLPEEVHELKATLTWAPSANYSVTLYNRYRIEENNLNYNTYEQETLSPGVNVWWAPVNNLNMTMAYNFNKQETENQMCVGWYHG